MHGEQDPFTSPQQLAVFTSNMQERGAGELFLKKNNSLQYRHWPMALLQTVVFPKLRMRVEMLGALSRNRDGG
jgi:hypothetical protein